MSGISRRPIRLIVACLAIIAAVRAPSSAQNAEKVKGLFNRIQWRGIGPALMGGRTVDIEAVENRPWIIYAAIGPSGVWKSENNGVTWSPVFFKESTVSVGDIAVSQANPSIVWAGTGEATCRNSVTIGDGVYRSADAGKTWTNMGLRDTRHISRILINRGDPNIVHVAAMGHLWGPNPDRGVFRTTDGGKTWTKVLYVNDKTGIADIAQDPSDSLTLYAAAYEYQRYPYDYKGGGPGSGIYKSEDGGATWKRMTRDLPEGVTGRIGLAVSRTTPGVVYALIEHNDGGIWRSENYGENWKRTCDAPTFKRVNSRPFYYSQILVDPMDDKTVYVLSTGLFVSNDMGRKFRPIGTGIHPDHHALWIDPSNPAHLIEGNDGGIDISYDGGKNWLPVRSMDLAEVYQVGYDMGSPYGVYCGLQDNGVWGGPSASLDPRGIANAEWYMVGGGDGFFARPDPADPNTIYSNSQMNGIQRYDRRIGRGKTIKPAASWKTPPYRFNWNSPILVSPHDPKTVFCAGNYLFRTNDGGNAWEIISPDLTTNDPAKQKDAGGPISVENSGAEVHCTIVTVAQSPVTAEVIWCGTDDGNLQLTRDGGKTWGNTAASIPGLPKGTWCSRIEASRFDAGTAYAAFDGHRTDDYASYLFKTSDFGKTWKSLRAGLPFGWVHVVREDPKNRNLLFAGTEFGIYASLDAGASWFSLMNNLPTVAVNDIAIHPRDNDLIIGTHGRGVWIMDDIAFLQEMSEDVVAGGFHLFAPKPSTLFWTSSKDEPYGKAEFLGKNPPYGALVTTWNKSDVKEKLKLLIRDGAGKSVAEMNLNQSAGVQRDAWNLQFVPEASDGVKYMSAGSPMLAAQPLVKPGIYGLEIETAGTKYSGAIEVRADDRIAFPDDQWTLQTTALGDLMKLSKRMGLAVTSARNIRRHLDIVIPEAEKTGDKGIGIRAALAAFNKAFSPLETRIVPADITSYQGSLESSLRGGTPALQLIMLGSSISGFPSGPTRTEFAQLSEISAMLDAAIDELNVLIKTAIPGLNENLKANALKPFPDIPEAKL
jgi:photosystem II stability/assembly factor-like uncharacterized protein